MLAYANGELGKLIKFNQIDRIIAIGSDKGLMHAIAKVVRIELANT